LVEVLDAVDTIRVKAALAIEAVEPVVAVSEPLV